MIVNIVLTNTSDRDINIASTVAEEPGEFDFGVDVRDGKANPAQHTQWGHKIQGEESTPPVAMRSSTLELPVKPGASIRPRIIVNRLFDIHQPGKYKIRVGRFDPGSGVTVLSNTLTVAVTP